MKKYLLGLISILFFTAANVDTQAAHLNGYELKLHNVKTPTGQQTSKYYFELKVYNSIEFLSPSLGTYSFDVYRYHNFTNTKLSTLVFSVFDVDTIKQINDCTPDIASSYYYIVTFRSPEFFASTYNDNLGTYYIHSEAPFSGSANYVNLSYVPLVLEFKKLTNVFNTSPSFNHPPAINYYLGQDVYEDWSVTDPDGDSVRYSLVKTRNDWTLMPFDTYAFETGFSLDSNIAAGDPDISIDQNGIMHFRPMQFGVFVVSVKIEEFRRDTITNVWNKLTETVSDRLLKCFFQIPIDTIPTAFWNGNESLISVDTILTEHLRLDTFTVDLKIKDSSDFISLRLENISGINKDFRIDTTALDSGILVIGGNGIAFQDFNLRIKDSLHLSLRYVVDTNYAINKPYRFHYYVIDSAVCNRVDIDTLIHELHVLKLRCNSNETITQNVCDSVYVFNGVKLYESGYYSDTLLNQFLCDSIVNLSLLIYPKIDSFIITGDSIIIDTLQEYIYSVPFQDQVAIQWNVTGGIVTDTISNTSLKIKWFDEQFASIECVFSNPSCSYRSEKWINVDHIVGINSMKSDLKIFPNPSDNYINIICDNFEFAEVFDARGRMIISSNLNRIDVSNFESGLYIMNVHTKDESIKTKFLKQ